VQQKEVDQSSTQSWKGLVMHNKDHGTIAMSYHVVFRHSIVLRLYQMQHFGVATQFDVPKLLRRGRSHCTASISDFFNSQTPYKKTDFA